MVKVIVNYESKDRTKVITGRLLIVKTNAFEGNVQAELFGEISIFGPEIRIYSETLPAMERVLKAVGIETIFWPKFVILILNRTRVLLNRVFLSIQVNPLQQ